GRPCPTFARRACNAPLSVVSWRRRSVSARQQKTGESSGSSCGKGNAPATSSAGPCAPWNGRAGSRRHVKTPSGSATRTSPTKRTPGDPRGHVPDRPRGGRARARVARTPLRPCPQPGRGAPRRPFRPRRVPRPRSPPRSEIDGRPTRFLADRIRGIDTGHIHGDPVHYPDRYETARIEHAIVLYLGLQRRAQPIVRLRPGSACETPDGK